MNIKLYKDDTLRITGDHEGNNFIDIGAVGYESLAIDLCTIFYYIEVRRKGEKVRIFTFLKKSHKKSCDFGWWEDAEVILAINEQTVNK